MPTALFLVWLQMSAPAPCQSAKLYYDGVLVDEEPHCGLLNQAVNMPTALDDITRQEFSEAAQRAADETDGKPLTEPSITTTVAGPLTVMGENGQTILTCEMADHVPHNCEIAEGHSLDEAMASLYHALDPHPGKFDCDTRSGERKLVDSDHLGQCLYNGATFDDWGKWRDTNERSAKICQKRGWTGTAAYFDPILQKTEQWPCSTIRKSQ